MAKLPKEYLVCKKKFNLDKKAPRVGILDFVSLSPEALNACRRVTIMYEVRRSQHKELVRLAKEYNFKLVIKPESVGVLTKALRKSTVITNEADLSIPDAVTSATADAKKLIAELEKSHHLPQRDYVVEIVGKPLPTATEKNNDPFVLTMFGPMRKSEFEALTRPSIMSLTTTKHYFTGELAKKASPVTQQAYYDRVALAEAMSAKLPWRTSVRDRNAFKFHICREMSDEEVTNLAVDTTAQDELVKGFAVKK